MSNASQFNCTPSNLTAGRYVDDDLLLSGNGPSPWRIAGTKSELG